MSLLVGREGSTGLAGVAMGWAWACGRGMEGVAMGTPPSWREATGGSEMEGVDGMSGLVC